MKKLIVICLVAVMSFAVSTISAAPKQEIVTTVFRADIDCESCAKKIMSSIPYQKGVKDVKVDIPKKEVRVSYDPEKSNNEVLLKSFAKLKINVKVEKK